MCLGQSKDSPCLVRFCQCEPTSASYPKGQPISDVIHSRKHITSTFGWRKNPVFHIPEFHTGIDLSASLGTPIHVPIPGIIEEAARKGTYGLFVKIRHSLDFETAYAHLSAFAAGVRPGVMLQPGELRDISARLPTATGRLVFEGALI